MLARNLNNNNFKLYAIRSYTNDFCADEKEFYSDLRRLQNIRSLIGQYKRGKEINYRLLVNYFVIVFNNFQAFPAINMLFFHSPKESHPQLKAILKFLNMLPLSIDVVDLRDIEIDLDLFSILEKEI